jgi:hypothetical protein
MTFTQHVYEIRPRKDKDGFDLVSDALRFGRVWYTGSNAVSHAIELAKTQSQSQDFVIRLYDDAGNLIETYLGADAKLLSTLS